MERIVTTDRVRFGNGQGQTLVGDLYRPADADADAEPRPALVVTGSWTTVKEQMAGLYARRMTTEGFVTVAFDHTGYGQSGGRPRDVEDPPGKASDIHAAVGHLAAVDGVDAGRVGALAVCASAGYTAMNAADDDRVRSVGLVAPWLHDPELVQPYYGGEEGVARLLQQAAEARAVYEQTGEVRYVPAVSETDEAAAMTGPFGYYLDPERGAIPEWGARFAVMAWNGWLTLDAVGVGRRVRQPVAMIHSRDAAVPDGARAFHDALPDPRGLTWIEGDQLDFYDQPAQVDAAVAAMTDHFRSTL